MKTITLVLILILINILPSWAFLNSHEFQFGGTGWVKRNSVGPSGPGPNIFGSEGIQASPDGIKLEIKKIDGNWQCAEIFTFGTFSYGTFDLEFSLVSRIDSNAVFGLFLYNREIPPLYNEIDFEIARWGNSENNNCQFTVQPYEKTGNSISFSKDAPMKKFRLLISWTSEFILFTLLDNKGRVISSWEYDGPDIPRNTKSRFHINAWLFDGQQPYGDGILSIIIHKFEYRDIFDNQD